MTKKEKLVERYLKMPADFHFDEIVKLLGYMGFILLIRGKHLVPG
jgi:hypothetical protein